jgi:hypothetical protein
MTYLPDKNKLWNGSAWVDWPGDATAGAKIQSAQLPAALSSGRLDVSIGASTTVPVSGALTDTQLRASAVPISAAALLCPAEPRKTRLSPTAPSASAAPSPSIGRLPPAPGHRGHRSFHAAAPSSTRLSDGAAFYDAAKTGQLPSALVTGRLDVNVGASTTIAVSQSGTWNVGTLTGITNVVHVDDNSGSLTVDAPVGTPVFVRLSDGAAAITTLPISGSVSISGTVTTQDSRLPSALGQTTMAASLPVVIASDQTALSEVATAADSGSLPAVQKMVSGYDRDRALARPLPIRRVNDADAVNVYDERTKSTLDQILMTLEQILQAVQS